ncbi:MAG: bifunctional 2-C-methyl-D-erythritol 4-phosphate cytidylyltransferase/2-C-methyl-D-erythritol 2,4-cyclodiphosphate synthase [Treponemataceae bacterium]|nr:MAG: bifunctional 2-C-methyl-D-erythritol 4-phosphate cytidylyltransferase/2-C-methyl-D-erythritol 2,4-cyclodiphosphate synthase [Treponemataceae bacterium]
MISSAIQRMKNSAPLFAVITAAGSSSRMGGGKKEFMETAPGETALSRSLRVFLRFNPARLVVTLPSENFDAYKQLAAQPVSNSGAKIDFVSGGTSRRESVFNALEFLDSSEPDSIKESAVVLIHDGARPWIDEALVRRVMDAARQYGAACPMIPPVDTLMEKDADGFAARHLDRASLAAAQTPQGFWFMPFLAAHKAASEFLRRQGTQVKAYTDDTEIWDEFAAPKYTPPRMTKLTEGSPQNIKITYPKDIAGRGPVYRAGLGCDTHPLVPGRKLVLGGIHIPFGKGEAGHSDGDALLHAVIDALLGAAALGDIGSFFPPDDAAYKDADSRELLAAVWKAVTEAGWRLENLDCVAELEAPKFLPFRDAARESIAGILKSPVDRVFVKAKTGEKMGEVGRGEAVKAWAMCLLKK